jgi:carnitine-CoA ligase
MTHAASQSGRSLRTASTQTAEGRREQHALDDLVLGEVLRKRALTHHRETFLRFRDGDLSFGEVEILSNRAAQGFAAIGVDPGDHVALVLDNCPELVTAVFGLAKLGAVAVPVNTAYEGSLLAHVLATSDAVTVVADEAYVDRLAPIIDHLRKVRQVVVKTDHSLPPSGLGRSGPPTVPFGRLLEHGDEPPQVEVSFSDLQAIMYTSGTTGPAKGVMVPHALALTCALDSLTYLDGWGKRYYCPLPQFHAAGLWDGTMAALLSGSAIAITERFSASRFWEDVREFDANVALGVISMIPILLNQPPRPDDRDHSLETFYMGKSALDERFHARFGVHTVETYTSTEAGIPIASPYGQWRTGSCGQENSERFEVAVVDEHDREVGPGEGGELVVRPRQPYVITTGYYGYWEHTARVFRNQWFHTGDRLSRDEDGYFTFLDRMKDAIRRRGENISAFDLEQEINLHPHVLESAAIGVPSELEEEEVKVVVVLQPGKELGPAELIRYCEERLPAFMVPRYVEFADELPRTANGKLAKHELRAQGDRGLTSRTWDREAGSGKQRDRTTHDRRAPA